MDNEKKEERQEVRKHSAAIQIENKITLLQEKTWNVLLWNAYDALPTQEIHSMRVQDLMGKLEYQSKNEEYLKAAIRGLVACSVEWNVLNKDNSPRWGVAALLASAEINNGTCTYAFAPHLRPILHHPNMYARICLTLQNRFESKHSLRLWEVLLDYLGAKRDYGESPVIPLADYRKLMGFAKGEYPNFRDFNQRVIKEPVEEINHLSDFRVTVHYIRQGRKVTALKFKLCRVALLPEPENVQAKLFPELDDVPVIVKELKDAGLGHQDALIIWQDGFNCVVEQVRPKGLGDDVEAAFVQYIREKIHLLKRRQARGKVENSTGFLLKAIRENYANPEFAQEQKCQAAVEEQQAKRGKVKELKALREKMEEIRDEEDTALMTLSNRVIEESPGLLEQAIAALREGKDAAFSFCYDPDHSPMENYRHHAFVAGAVVKWLEGRFPEQYDEVRATFHCQRAEIETRIKELEGEGIKALAYA